MAIEEKTATKRSLRAIETKNTIFTTALHLFSKYGYEKVTVDDIVCRAGVSKGAFYHHFTTKEAILVEQFNKIDDAYDDAFAHAAQDMRAQQQLLRLGNTMTNYCATVCGSEVIRMVYAAQIAGNRVTPILNNKNRRIYRYLRQIVSHGTTSGEFTGQLPEDELVAQLMRACRSLVYDWCLYDGRIDLPEEGQKFFQLLLSWIEPK